MNKTRVETLAVIESPAVAVIEDDEHAREAFLFQLETAGLKVASHPSAESFLDAPGWDRFDCIVADICLPKKNGLQLLAEIKQSAPFVSIVFITAHGDMSIGVQAMKDGAVDCLEKPIEGRALLEAIRRGTSLSRVKRSEHMRCVELKKRECTLTPREREVFALITAGLLNKQAGADLGSAEHTVKIHRGRVMKKMRANSLADLVRMAEILELHGTSKHGHS